MSTVTEASNPPVAIRHFYWLVGSLFFAVLFTGGVWLKLKIDQRLRFHAAERLHFEWTRPQTSTVIAIVKALVGEERCDALLGWPIGIHSSNTDESDPECRTLFVQSLSEYRGLTSVSTSFELGPDDLELIAHRHNVSQLRFSSRGLCPRCANSLAQLKSVKMVMVTINASKMANDWSWIEKLSPSLDFCELIIKNPRECDLRGVSQCPAEFRLCLEYGETPAVIDITNLRDAKQLVSLTIRGNRLRISHTPGSYLPSALNFVEIDSPFFDDLSLNALELSPEVGVPSIHIAQGIITDTGLARIARWCGVKNVYAKNSDGITGGGLRDFLGVNAESFLMLGDEDEEFEPTISPKRKELLRALLPFVERDQVTIDSVGNFSKILRNPLPKARQEIELSDLESHYRGIRSIWRSLGFERHCR